jgi:hypothetical protein
MVVVVIVWPCGAAEGGDASASVAPAYAFGSGSVPASGSGWDVPNVFWQAKRK